LATTPTPINRGASPPVPGGEPYFQTRPLPKEQTRELGGNFVREYIIRGIPATGVHYGHELVVSLAS